MTTSMQGLSKPSLMPLSKCAGSAHPVFKFIELTSNLLSDKGLLKSFSEHHWCPKLRFPVRHHRSASLICLTKSVLFQLWCTDKVQVSSYKKRVFSPQWTTCARWRILTFLSRRSHLRVIGWYQNSGTRILVCPAVVLFVWMDEVFRCSTPSR